MPGVRQKVFHHGGKQIRLVEYSQEMQPHWCEKGHYGYMIEGTFEIEFSEGKQIFQAGDGLFLPAGPEHRHRAQVLTDIVKVVFVEDL